MKIKYSWKWFFSSILVPLILLVVIAYKDFNGPYNLNYFFIIFFSLYSLFILTNCYKFFFGFYINIDDEDIIIIKSFLNLKKLIKINEIKWITSEKGWIVISNKLKEFKIKKDFINTTQIKSFYDELSSKTKLEIKFYD